MTVLKDLTAEQILAIPKERPDRLFKFDNLKEDRRILHSIWHTDRSKHPKAKEVFQHIQALLKVAEEQIENKSWVGNGILTWVHPPTCVGDTRCIRFHYKKAHAFELGKMYVSNNYVVYVIDQQYGKLVDNAIKQLANIKYINDKVKTEFTKYVPTIAKNYSNSDIGHVLMFNKTPDQVLLADLLDYMPDNKLPPRHTAWIMSSLLNQACFYITTNLVHNAILPSTIFVSPEFHSAMPIGGWWYARQDDDKLLSLPGEVINILPSKLLVDKKAKLDYNNRLIRATGIECLGDTTRLGSKLLMDKDIPKPLLTWLRGAPADNAMKDYKGWNGVLDDCWGKRTFVELKIDIEQVYA